MVVGSADRLQLQNELQFAGSINRCACRRENLDLQGYNVSIELLFLASAEMIDATLRLGNDSCMDFHRIGALPCGLQHGFFRNWFRYDLHCFLLFDLKLQFIRG
jgi:hypothetical protein